MPDLLRLDRDRYVGFAFAAADLLFEIDMNGKILSAAGAAQSLVGRTAPALIGVDPTDLVSPFDRALMRHLLRKLVAGGRLDATAIHLDHAGGGRALVLLGGCTLPSVPGRAFISLTLAPAALGMIDRARDETTNLLTKESLLALAQQTATGSSGPSPRQLTLVSLDGLSNAAAALPPERASLLMEEIGASLRAQSAGGDAAGRLGDDQFGYVATGPGDPQRQKALVTELQEAIKSAGIDHNRVGSSIAELDLASDTMSADDAAKSLAYAVNQFTKTHGSNFKLASMKAGLDAAIAETAARYSAVKRLIDQELFTLVYQPVVALDTLQVHHYEALARFPGGHSPFETITFSEEIGLVYDLDFAICQRAIKEIESSGASVAVNLSGRSVQSDAFRERLSELVRPLSRISQKLLFELTESSAVDSLEEAAAFLRWLRRLGFQVCLDDFGAGAAAYSYLRRFDVDFVKIDGPFLKAAKQQKRERALIRSVCRLCKELDTEVIGEMIEDQQMVDMSTSMGVSYGQGWLFGRPLPDIPAPMVGRRKGTTETWQ